MKKSLLSVLIGSFTLCVTMPSIAGVYIDNASTPSANIVIHNDVMPAAAEEQVDTQPTVADNLYSVASAEVEPSATESDVAVVAEAQKQGQIAAQAVMAFDTVSEKHAGKHVPLELAVTQIVPTASEWSYHIQDSMLKSEVSWSGGKPWNEVLNDMESDKGELAVYFNMEDKVVGIGANALLASHLAKPVPTLWYLDSRNSIRENVIHWAEVAGWNVDWKADKNYRFQHSAYVTGDFFGKNGAIHQLMRALKTKSHPLRAEFNIDAMGNKTVVIQNLTRQIDNVESTDYLRQSVSQEALEKQLAIDQLDLEHKGGNR